ncbi:c-type cytochrome [Herpetosiphon sp. NSE202]|uniref:c-type cytochrome n=1 Tax=Herpetosiphon sp. NSE202 TaxID=3351349 RepID=UPI00363ACDB9
MPIVLRLRSAVAGLALVGLAACGSATTDSNVGRFTGVSTTVPVAGNTASSSGDAAAGKAIFDGTTALAGAPPCLSCHVVDAAKPQTVGPNLAGIGAHAATRVAGQSANAYLHSSIVDPNSYVVDGFAQGLMFAGYGDALTPQQVDDVVAYLLSLQ